jgi:hypothetical protein
VGGSSKAQTVGYRYYMDIHMGLGRGPLDELVEIRVADETAWSGSVTASGQIRIDAPDLFGGDSGEGGIEGTLDVMMGEPTQGVHAKLQAMVGGLVSAFRGRATLFYSGLLSSMNPYPKAWKMRVRRALKGWDGDVWYPERCVIALQDANGKPIRAMNPAHIIYECLTNTQWSRGIPRSRIDDASFRAAADALYAEGFGLCLRWNRESSVNEFIQTVVDHIGGARYIDRKTGLMVLKLIRDDYTVADLPLFTPDTGLLSITDDDNSSSASSANQVIVTWHDPVTDEDGTVRVNNLANIASTGSVASSKVEYPGLPTQALAVRVASRDLRAFSAGVKRFKLQLDRRGWVYPGAAFRVSVPARGIANLVLRAGRVDEDEKTGKITVTAVLDVFGLPATSYVQRQGSDFVPPNRVPQAVTTRRLQEVNYRDLVAGVSEANLQTLDPTSGFLAALAVRPNGLSLSYLLRTRVGGAAFAEVDTGAWCPTGLLATAIEPLTSQITLTQMVDLDLVSVGSPALIDEEIVRVDAVDVASGKVTLARGCVDTVPVRHLAGARIWFYEQFPAIDPIERGIGLTVQAQLLTRTSAGQLDPSLASTDSLTFAQRQYRPYPPGNLLINYTALGVTRISGGFRLDWSHRSRLLQADQLLQHTAGNVGPEAGTTYTLRIYNGTTFKRVIANITGTSWTYDAGDAAADGPIQALRFTLTSVRDGIEAWQAHDVSLQRWGAGFQLGLSVGGVLK